MKVLVVDDEKIIREGIACMLKGTCWIAEIWQAPDGFSALEYLRHSRADAVVTDILMPEMDGLEFIGRARQEKLCENFIILSGYAEFSYAQQAIVHDVSRYLLKPVDQEELLEALLEVKERKEEKREERNGNLSVQELTARIRGNRISQNEIKRLIEGIRGLPGELYPESLKIKLLFELVLAQPEAEKQVEDCLKECGFLPGEAAAAALCRAMMYFIDRKDHPLSVRKALLYTMKEYSREKFGLTYAAGELFMNANYLSGLVSHSIGISFNTFVRLLRVSQAQALLKAEDASIQKICSQCGFGNVNLFFRTFRDVAGMTPMSYKKEGL